MRFLTAGESHGPGLVVIVEGLPRGVEVSLSALVRDLARRRAGYGRGPRASGEPENIEILAGVRSGLATGSPVAVLLRHRNWETWKPLLDPVRGEGCFVPSPDLAGVEASPARPRPGHADLAGAIKYGLTDLRDIIERSSARETAARTVAGALARSLLASLGVTVGSYVSSIGPVHTEVQPELDSALDLADLSPVRTPDSSVEERMIVEIDRAKEAGDTLGGTFVLTARGVAPGLGSYAQWDRRLDGRLAAAVMSIPSIKGVEIGGGFALTAMRGSGAHDAIIPNPPGGVLRPTNRAGGIEGGLTNGEPVLIRAAVKPVPTLGQPLPSMDLRTGEAVPASYERSDTCVVPAASVVGEAMTAWVLAEAYMEKFSGDSLREVERALSSYQATRPWHGRG